MAITCLNNLVDIVSNCNAGARTSGVMYLDDIGISLQDAMDANDSLDSGQDLVDNTIAFCQNIIANDVLSNYDGKIKRNSVVGNGIIGRYREDRTEKTITTAQNGGVFLEINQYPYLEVYISTVTLFTKEAETFDLKIWDVMTGQELYSQEVTTNASDYTIVDVYDSFKTNGQKTQLLIGYAIQDVTYYLSDLNGDSTCLSCRPKTADGFSYQYGAKINQADTLSKSNLALSTDTCGVSVQYSLNCTIDNFVCSIKNQLQYPLLYLVGAKLMEKTIFSKRTNSTTLIFEGDAREMRDLFMTEYKTAMFGEFNEDNKNVKSGLLDRLRLPNDVCFKCNSRVRKIVSIP